MLAGGDSIWDVNVLRTGGTDEVFDGVRAPSTIGTWLRAFKWSNVRQLDAIGRELLAGHGWLVPGPADLAAPLTIDLDSTICPVYGRGKPLHQGPRQPPAAAPARRPGRCCFTGCAGAAPAQPAARHRGLPPVQLTPCL
jgi:hypothetical protein